MRIQHNIMAMNSYRNLSANNSALAKNLEKLSSGYKINRAGDDAAGLAISEKMRAQITGLDTAQKNAKDGITLVQTAEGALTEVHDMLNRMVELADQSANGTYANEVDRENLQAEINQLKSEINRIADSSNFNGINLLDGSLESLSGATTVKLDNTALTTTTGTAFTQTLEINTTSADGAEGTAGTMKLTIQNADGVTSRDATISFTFGKDADTTASNMKNAMKSVFGGDYNVTVSGNEITIAAANEGKDDGKIVSATMYDETGKKIESNVPTVNTATAGTDVKFSIGNASLKNKAKLEIDGQKFQILKYTDKAEDGYTGIYLDKGTAAGATADELKQVAAQLQSHGINAEADSTNGIDIIKNTNSTSKGGLVLQIGDTSDSFNQMTVGIADMHTDALGIAGVDISTQSGAAAAVQQIKNAINAVSSNRGTLGAIQNRLEHTINNLSVMEENIQDAESNIRDTDIADEMMTYTKNNILIQSAQAMLAQANQVPQGVLQLMQ